jgi:hypothetical protein
MKALFNLFTSFSMLFLLLMCGGIVIVGNEIHGCTVAEITPGITDFESGSYNFFYGGDLDNQGTIILKGNLVNQNASPADLGTGTIEFSGTSAQTISGQNEFGILRVANTAGVTIISGDQIINNSLNLKNGLLKLENNNLLLGIPAIDSGGSVSSMVVATGIGELRKAFPASPSFPVDFTFPVGDADGTAEYSPVAVHFTAGTFIAGNYLGINLKNLRDPLLNTDNYLDRYWKFNNNNISGLSCTVTLNFTEADVHGIKDDLYFLKTDPALEYYDKYSAGNQLTGTVTSFSRFTGSNIIDITPNITAEPNVMHGITNYDVIVQVTELNYGNTNGLITILIPKDYRWSFTYNPSATLINGKPVNNSAWTYTDEDPYHKFTSSSVISKNTYSKFGFIAAWNSGQTKGTYTITSQITSWSGGECRIDNNSDAEKLDYFID